MEVGTSQFESGESYLLLQMRFFYPIILDMDAC